MDLIIDVGNSFIKCGLFDKNKLKHFYVYKTTKNFSLAKFKKENITGVAFSSVVDSLTPVITKKIKAMFKVPICDIDSIKNSIKILPIIRKKNQKIGGDLIADLVAANKIYGAPSLIFDIGTVSKVLALDKNATFIGASFFPGLDASARSLFNETSALPTVKLTHISNLVGIDTVSCIKSGVINSVKYSINGFTNDYGKILGSKMRVIITGGGSVYIKNLLNNYIYNPYLTLYGIYFIYKERNK